MKWTVSCSYWDKKSDSVVCKWNVEGSLPKLASDLVTAMKVPQGEQNQCFQSGSPRRRSGHDEHRSGRPRIGTSECCANEFVEKADLTSAVIRSVA